MATHASAGVASGGLVTITDASFNQCFNYNTHGGKQPNFTVYASGSAIEVQIAPNHAQGINPTLKSDVIPAGESRTYWRYGPGGEGLIETLDLKALTPGGQASWST